MNKAQMMLAAVGGLLSGYQGVKNKQYDRDLEERKLDIQDRAAQNKEPSSGIANLNFLAQTFPDEKVSREEAFSLLSPTGFAPSPEMRAFNQNPQAYGEMKSAGRPKLDLGGGDPPPSRPAISAPPSKPSQPNSGEDAALAAAQALAERMRNKGANAAAPSEQPKPLRVFKRDPATGALTPVGGQ